MNRCTRLNSKYGHLTFYLSCEGQQVQVWRLESTSGTVQVVALGVLEETVLEGHLGSFNTSDNVRLAIFAKTHSALQYAWVDIDESVGQSLTFNILKLDHFQPTFPLSIVMAASQPRFAVLLASDTLLIGEEIKTSLLAVNASPVSWVTDLGVFKNYVQPENDLLISLVGVSFSESHLLVVSKDQVTQLLNVSVCEVDWMKRKLKVLWRLPTYTEHVRTVCIGNSMKDGKVLVCVHNTACVYDMEGQQMCVSTLPSAISSAAPLRSSAAASESIVSTTSGKIFMCQIDHAMSSMLLDDITPSLVQLTDYTSHVTALSSQCVFTEIDVLHAEVSQGRRSLTVVGRNALTSVLCLSSHILHEFSKLRTLGFAVHRAAHISGDQMARFPTHAQKEENAPVADVTFISTLSLDLESVFDAHALAPVLVGGDMYVVLTSRVTQQTSILLVNSNDPQASSLANALCTLEYTHGIYSLANYVVQVTSSMLFVYNTVEHSQWKVAWNDLVSSTSNSHKIRNLTILFAIPCHHALFLYCTNTLVKVWFNVSALSRGHKQAVRELIVEEITCRCAAVTGSTFLYPDSDGRYDFVIAQSYWEDSVIKLDYYRYNPTNKLFHSKVCVDVPLPSTPQHHEIVKDMKIVLRCDVMHLIYHYKHQLVLCEVEYDTSGRQLCCTTLWSYALTPTVHISHISVASDYRNVNAVGVVVLLNNDSVLEVCMDCADTPHIVSYYLPYSRIQSVHKIGKEIICNFQEEMGHGIGRCVEAENRNIGNTVTRLCVVEGGQKVLMGKSEQSIVLYKENDSRYSVCIYSSLSLDMTVEHIPIFKIHSLPTSMDYHSPYGNMFYTISINRESSCVDVHAFQFDTHRRTVTIGGKASCSVYTHTNLIEDGYHHASVSIGGKEHLVLLTNTSNLCLFGWNESKQFTVLCLMEVSVCSPSLKMVKLPWDSAVSLMLVHSVITYNEYVAVNLVAGKIILFQCSLLTSGKFVWKILLELAMERPVLAMHSFPPSLASSDRQLYDIMTFFAYSRQSEDIYLYHVSIPTANADEDTLAASVINPTYVCNRYVLDTAVRSKLKNSQTLSPKAVVEGDLCRPLYSTRRLVGLRSAQRLEHMGSDENCIRDVAGVWWQILLDSKEEVILQLSACLS
eukprot:gene32693-39526_t